MKRIMSLLIIASLLLCFTNVGLAVSNNNSFETAKRLTLSQDVVDTLESPDEDDYFYVIVPSDVNTMRFYLQNIPSDADYGMIIYDENLDAVVYPVRAGNNQEAVVMTVKPNERYYIRVMCNYGSGSYRIGTMKNTSFEPNDTLKTVTTTYANLFYFCDTLSDGDTTDWYRIQIPAGSHQLYLRGIPLGSNYDLFVYDFNGTNLIASSTSSRDTECVYLTGGQTYAVKVSLLNGGDPFYRYTLYVDQ